MEYLKDISKMLKRNSKVVTTNLKINCNQCYNVFKLSKFNDETETYYCSECKKHISIYDACHPSYQPS